MQKLTKYGPYPTPYLFHKTKENQILYYIGSKHIYDPTITDWNVIDHYWHKFRKLTESQKRITLVEGGNKRLKYRDPLKMREWGESYYLWSLAKKYNIEVTSPEPNRIEQMKYLNKRFSKIDIVTTLFVEQLCAYGVKTNDIDEIKANLSSFLHYLESKSMWNKDLFEIKTIANNFRKITGKRLDLEDHDFHKELGNPYLKNNLINKITYKKSSYRDKYILEKIKQLWQQHYSIFIIYGKNHAIAHELVINSWSF